MKRALVSLLLAAWCLFGLAARAEDEAPATPTDAAELYAVYKVVPAGTPGAREVVWAGSNTVWPRPAGPVFIAPQPLLTLRDVEKITFPGQAVTPGQPLRAQTFHGQLTFSKSGARRRYRVQSENERADFAELHDGVFVRLHRSVARVMGNTDPYWFSGTLDDLIDYEGRLQGALKKYHEQPIRVVREAGEHALAPGWKLKAEPIATGLRLTVTGPLKPDGHPWSAKAELPTKAPFIFCWETQGCVLWAASEKQLTALRFEPAREPMLTTGERESELRFCDAPEAVRREIEHVFPPKDGDPALQFGSIEGVLLLAGKPAPDVAINAYARFNSDTNEDEILKVKTDAEGRFRFAAVHAPAHVQVNMEPMTFIHPGTKVLESTASAGLSFSTQLAKDQVLELTLGGEGQPVAGKIVDPAQPQRDWSQGQVELKLVPPCSMLVEELRSKNLPFLADAYEGFLQAERGRAYAPGKVALRADGSFRFERIPSARYWVYVYPDDADKKSRVKNLQMPLLPLGKSEQALDLGEVKWSEEDARAY